MQNFECSEMIEKRTTTEEEVIFYDTDCGGVVSNIAYLRYVEKARCQLFADLGMELGEMNETGLFPTVIRSEIDYLKPAKLGDRLTIEAEVKSIRRVRIECGFKIVNTAEEKVTHVEAIQTVVLVQMPGGKPVRPPGQWVGNQ